MAEPSELYTVLSNQFGCVLPHFGIINALPCLRRCVHAFHLGADAGPYTSIRSRLTSIDALLSVALRLPGVMARCLVTAGCLARIFSRFSTPQREIGRITDIDRKTIRGYRDRWLAEQAHFPGEATSLARAIQHFRLESKR